MIWVLNNKVKNISYYLRTLAKLWTEVDGEALVEWGHESSDVHSVSYCIDES